MGLLQRIFGGASSSQSFTEKDNRGTRHDDKEIATAYWLTRINSPKKDPFILYEFDTEDAARQALLELPCIHIAKDSGKLICTEVLIFGHCAVENGKHEAVICGDDLTHDLWAQAKASFIQHGGRPKNSAEQEPEQRAAPVKQAAAPKPDRVNFVREDRRQMMGRTMVYRIHKAPDAASAKAFLEQNPVTKELLYLVVETPEGNYCRDLQGIYKE